MQTLSPSVSSGASFEAKAVLEVLGADEVHFDEIQGTLKTPVKTLSTLLTKMELDGILAKLPGNYYVSRIGKK